MTKHFTLLAGIVILSLASCAKTGLVSFEDGNNGAIGFSVVQKNMTKATLDSKGHYNFGVFAYKNTDLTNNVMSNYLVGYQDATNKKGYYMSSTNQTTVGDAGNSANGQSMWQYEKLGSSEYSYTGSDGYYKKTETAYMSNNANQYLRYWDYSSASTNFYAYAPYINGTGTATFDPATSKLTIPDGSIEHAFVEDGSTSDKCDYLYAATNVPVANYNNDVVLSFKRLNAKVNIKFWENIEGYSVKIIKLTNDYGVSAAPSIMTAGTPNTYELGKYYSKSGAVIDFSTIASPTVTQASGTECQAALKFTVPSADAIGTTQATATASPTTYYAIPKTSSATNTTGFTFHVSYQLTSTTGEVIKVQNATVFVPITYTNWVANTAYTYIFKITKGSTGTTGDPGTINPNDPEAKTDQALYPIVFDGCTVEDYTANSSDHNING